MKKEFFAYIRPSNEEFQKIWNSCLFIFDANILLNFYKYTPVTTKTFFSIIEKLNDRIFLTHQASQEYFNNRLDVISEQEKAYSDVRDTIIKNIEEPLQNQKKHPHINDSLLNEFKSVAEKIKQELEEKSKEYSQKITDDDILDKLIQIFDGKVGKPFDEKRLIEIYQEGDKRYNENIPPGFKDQKKGGVRQFGDLVLWFQLIQISKDHKKDVIFITDDAKEDWVQIHKGKTIGPLAALQIEFNSNTGQKYYMYTASKFIELASAYLQTTVNDETIEEVRNLRAESLISEILEPEEEKLSDEEIDRYLSLAVNNNIQHDKGWAELPAIGLYLLKNTPINYRRLGFLSLKKFIESRKIFDIQETKKSPNAKAIDSAFVRIKETL